MDDLEGSKYRQGATGPYEFDSSGLINYLYEESRVYDLGEERPTCDSLAKTSIEMEEEDAKFGDLIIWTDDSGKTTHVAVYCGYDKIYECTPDSGVRYTKIYDKENAKFYRLAVND